MIKKTMNSEIEEYIILKKQIKNNNDKIAQLMIDNDDILDKIIRLFLILTPEQKERYDKELASDNWMKYSKTRNE